MQVGSENSSCPSVTEQDPMQASWGRPLPTSSASAALKYLNNSILSCFTDDKTLTMEDVNYVMTMST